MESKAINAIRFLGVDAINKAGTLDIQALF